MVVPRALDVKLRAAGASYYVRNSDSLETGAENVLIRLVTSFTTVEEDIERFVNLCATYEERPIDVRPSDVRPSDPRPNNLRPNNPRPRAAPI